LMSVNGGSTFGVEAVSVDFDQCSWRDT
jgi:hypothetical protein